MCIAVRRRHVNGPELPRGRRNCLLLGETCAANSDPAFLRPSTDHTPCCADKCLCEDDQTTPTSTACVDRSFEASGVVSKGLGLLRGESCAEVVGSASGHGGITGAELCQMTLSDLASNLAAGYTVGGASLSYTPPSGYTYVANLCPATCGSHGVGEAACGGSGITPVSASVVTTTTTAELRTRIANAPQTGCDFYVRAADFYVRAEEMWTIRCGNPTMIFLDQGTFLLGGMQVRGLACTPARDPHRGCRLAHTPPSPAQVDLRTNTVYEIIGHPGGSTLDAQGLSRIFDLDYKAALTLKNVTLINGRADHGGAIRLRSRLLAGTEGMPISVATAEAARLTIRGGAIRDCEATNDGGAVAVISEASMFGGAAGKCRLVVAPAALA